MITDQARIRVFQALSAAARVYLEGGDWKRVAASLRALADYLETLAE